MSLGNVMTCATGPSPAHGLVLQACSAPDPVSSVPSCCHGNQEGSPMAPSQLACLHEDHIPQAAQALLSGGDTTLCALYLPDPGEQKPACCQSQSSNLVRTS